MRKSMLEEADAFADNVLQSFRTQIERVIADWSWRRTWGLMKLLAVWACWQLQVQPFFTFLFTGRMSLDSSS